MVMVHGRTQETMHPGARSAPGSVSRQWYRIGDVAALTGVSPRTLRAWEERYRLVQPCRSPGGTRLYSQEDVERVRSITRVIAERRLSLRAIAEQLREGSIVPDRFAQGLEGRAGNQPLAGSEATTGGTLIEQLRRYRQLLEVTRQIHMEIGRVATVEGLLTLLCRDACRVFAVAGALIWLVDVSRRWLVGVAGWGPMIEPLLGQRHALTQPSFVATCARQQQVILSNNCQGRLSADRHLNMVAGAAAMMAAPLVSAAGETLGVLVLQEEQHSERFSRDDVEAVKIFAAQAAVALEQVRLFAMISGLCWQLAQHISERAAVAKPVTRIPGG